MDGIINVYKEKGFTSHDVVAKLRGIFHQKKIGHTGTLDPDATGVLPVCLGKATKVCDLLTDKDKTYQAVVRLGVVTDTQDMSGTILNKSTVNVTKEQLLEKAASFVGEISQIPPMYSAIKINGKKLYELAREGKEVERKPRQIIIHSIQIEEIDLDNHLFSMTVECQKGTYIRTLCHDLGQELGCGAVMEELIRTKVSDFSMDKALTLSEIEKRVKNEDYDFVLPVDTVFMHYPRLNVIGEEGTKRLMNGNFLYERDLFSPQSEFLGEKGQCYRIYNEEGKFCAIYTNIGKEYKPVKMF